MTLQDWSNLAQVIGAIDKRLMIPLAPALTKIFDTMPSSDDPLAPLHPRADAIVTKQKKSGHLSNLFADLLAQAGLRTKTPHRRTSNKGRGVPADRNSKLSFHCLRHTSVTLLKEAGTLVGHASVAMSQHYTHVGREALEKAANAMPDITD